MRYQVVFYVPSSHKERVKNALFAAGAGQVGAYDHCSWECEGTGQYRPLEGSNPFLGEENNLHQLTEYRVELICEDSYLHAAIAALRATHPYEEPAYSVFPLSPI